MSNNNMINKLVTIENGFIYFRNDSGEYIRAFRNDSYNSHSLLLQIQNTNLLGDIYWKDAVSETEELLADLVNCLMFKHGYFEGRTINDVLPVKVNKQTY